MGEWHPNEVDVALIEKLVAHDGWTALEEYLTDVSLRLQSKLVNVRTGQDETNYVRGQLYALSLLSRDRLVYKFRHAHGGPDA